MTAPYRWIVLLLCFQFTGCAICHDMKRRLFWEPQEFSWPDDRTLSLKIYRGQAEEIWAQIRQSDPDLRCAQNFEAGFKDGFVDYVFAGGSGDPPPVPPRRYWNVDFRTPGGHAVANQWTEGYRLGVRTARERGFRDQAVLQATFRYGLTPATAMPPYLGMPEAEMPALPMETLGPPPEILPMPEAIDIESQPDSTMERVPSKTDDKSVSLESPFAKYVLPPSEKKPSEQKPPEQKLSEQKLSEQKLSKTRRDSLQQCAVRIETTPPPKKGFPASRSPVRQALPTNPKFSSDQQSAIRVVY